MGIADLFRPKYRHSNVEVRADAVRQLGPDEADLLAEIAREDRDAAVRRIAIDKIESADALAEIAKSEPDRALREHTEERAAELWVSQAVSASTEAEGRPALAGLERMRNQKAIAEVVSRAEAEPVRAAALAKLTDPRALADLVRSQGATVAARQEALSRISDVDVLRSIAVDETRKDIALAVVDRIEDDEALESIATKGKNKAARARARKKLTDRKPPQQDTVSPEEKRRHAEMVQLVIQAETLSRRDDLGAIAAEMAGIRARWEAVKQAGDTGELVDRYERAMRRFDVRYSGFATAAAKAVEARRAEAERKAAEAAARRAAEETAAEEKAVAEKAATDKASAQAEKPAEEVLSDEERAAREAAASAKAEADRQRKEEESRRREEERQREEERKRQQAERQQRDLAALKELVDEMQKAAAGDAKKRVEKLIQRADKAFESFKLPSGASADVDAFHAARKALLIHKEELREAEDWQRWANVPRQEALIEQAKALMQEADESKLLDKLKALQGEWKNVGPVPQKKSQEMWQAFKDACDQVYARVKDSRAKVAEEQQANLVRKQELCERAEKLAESTDWDRTAEELKALQAEWKAIGPVPRKHADKIWQRFRGACDSFFERRKPHLEQAQAERESNLARKTELCQQAEELAESTDWQETSNALRDLQRQWREVGPVPRKESNAINKRFRAACDRFFDRRKNYREEQRQARLRRIADLMSEIRVIEAIVSGGGVEPEAAAAALAAEGAAQAESGAGEAGAGDAGAGEASAAAEGGAGEAEAAEGGAGEAEAAEVQADDAHAHHSPAVRRALKVRAELRELDLDDREAKEIFAAANGMYGQVVLAYAEELRGTELDPASLRGKLQKLVARAEEIAPAPRQALAEDEAQTPQQIAEKLRAAFAENAMSSSLAASTDGRSLVDTVAELRDAWMRVGPAVGPEAEALEERFRSACERALRSAGVSQ